MNLHKCLIIFLALIALPETASAVSRFWHQKAHIGGDARHRCTAFEIGNKGYYGGGHINSGTAITYQDYWEYDPATNSWTQIANYGGGLRYHSSAFTIGNAAYVGCGENGSHSYTNDWWKYVPEVNTWFPIADLPAIERRGGTAFAIDGKGYFGTGQSDDGYRIDFFSYSPETDTWIELSEFPGEHRSAAVSFSHDGKGYVGTGHKTGSALSDFYEYDPSTDTWTTKASVGGSIRQDAMAFVIDGKGYIGTGDDSLDNDLRDVWEYDFDADTWTQIGDFGGAKRHYATTFVIDNIVYLAGGTDGTNLKDLWAFAPTTSIEEILLNEVQINLYPNPSTDVITIAADIPTELQDQLSVQITDITGRTIFQSQVLNSPLKLYKSDFGNGIYFLNIMHNQAIVNTQKFIFN
ncbi:MAG: T9SS type A sorting domain-containing protein [Crocinitomix sp.]|nr:T9SS type A sorting domain-containing protein [Crocinitomix sp.]